MVYLENLYISFFMVDLGPPANRYAKRSVYGVVKMNLDTDMQWAFWDGVHEYYKANKDYLQAQLGNPEGDDKPNKKYYDPRAWLRSREQAFVGQLKKSFDDLNCLNRNQHSDKINHESFYKWIRSTKK